MIRHLKVIGKKYPHFMRLYYKMRFKLSGNSIHIQGENNKIIYSNARITKLNIDIKGSNNTILIGDEASVKECRIQMRGNDHTLDLGRHTVFVQCNFAFEDHHGLIRFGDYSTMLHHGEVAAVEPYSKVEIGERCMFSIHVDIRNTDSHSIIDLKTGKRINPGKNIKIGDKVWVGAYVHILKGANIGHNSIIGIRSLVTKDIPPHSLAAGAPAAIIRTEVDWCEERV